MDTQSTASDTAPGPVALGPEFTIAQAAAWRDTLVDALCTGSGNLTLDLSSVTDIDSAGLQLLLATRRSIHERGASLTLEGLSSTVAEALAVFGLDPQIDAIGPLNGAPA